jgi:hypothetical protein
MVFKKNLTKLSSKGRIEANRGKGSTTQRTAPRERETLTGGNPLERMMNQYPAAPQPSPTPSRAADLTPSPSSSMPSLGIPDKA